MIECGGQSPQEHDASSGSSLKRLQTDYIDLYWVHIWDGITPVEEVMRDWTISFAGKVLYVGISDAPPGGSPRQISLRSFEAGHSLSGCSSSTA